MPSPPEVLLGEWQLLRGSGPQGEILVPDGHPVTLTIAEHGWSGTAACNRYHGTVEVDGAQLAVHPVAVTAMACLDDAVMAAEAAYLAAFTTVDRWSLDDDLLQLRGPGAQLVFASRAAQQANAVVGTVWQLTGLFTGPGPQAERSRPAASAELVFGGDGRITGSTGCNRLRSTFELEGDVLRVGPVATTRMACTDDRLARQEQQVLAVLASERIGVEPDDDRLVLRAVDGRALEYRAS